MFSTNNVNKLLAVVNLNLPSELLPLRSKVNITFRPYFSTVTVDTKDPIIIIAGSDSACSSGLTVTPEFLMITDAYMDMTKLPPKSSKDTTNRPM